MPFDGAGTNMGGGGGACGSFASSSSNIRGALSLSCGGGGGGGAESPGACCGSVVSSTTGVGTARGGGSGTLSNCGMSSVSGVFCCSAETFSSSPTLGVTLAGATKGEGAGATRSLLEDGVVVSNRGDAIGEGAAVADLTVIPPGIVDFFFVEEEAVIMGGGTLKPPHFRVEGDVLGDA